MQFERPFTFQMHKIIFFPENLKKFYVSAVNLVGSGDPKHRYFLFGLIVYS